jgi:anthranilate phosphoribosyltransferase
VTLSGLVAKLGRREDLTADEARAAMDEVMTGRAAPAQIAGLLVGLAMKGERPAEIVGLARSMRDHAVRMSAPADALFDNCGTGGDRSGTFNISSCAAIVIAAAGVKVAKHGNRSISSRCGSADVFAALGVRTAFNLLGPLTNPAGATRQLVGVPRPEFTELLARALMMLGSTRAWVVHGADGIDEISTTGYTKISECHDGAVKTFYLHPADYGLSKGAPEDLKGGSAAANAAIIRRVLAGEPGPARDVVVLNAGAALFMAGAASSVREGMRLAGEAIDRGRAAQALERMAELSQTKMESQA